MESSLGRKYGADVDSYDPRDYKMAGPSKNGNTFVDWWKNIFGRDKKPLEQKNEKIDLFANFGPVKDQGDLGACTAFAYTGYREYLYRKFYEFEKDKTVVPANLVLSPLFLYYEERVKEGTISEDDGAEMRTGCQVLNQIGVCLEREDSYNPKHFNTPPSAENIENAAKYKSGAYHRLDFDLEMIKSCIRSGYPVAAGIEIYESFESDEVAKTGIVPLPNVSKEDHLGGHAILLGGIDDSRKLIKCRNSWGIEWGEAGNFYLPYEYINLLFVNDLWMTHLGPKWVSKRT